MEKPSTTKRTWDLSPLFKGDDDPNLAISEKISIEATKQFVAHWEKRTDWLEKPAILKKALDEYELWHRDFGANATVLTYLHLRQAQEQSSEVLKAKAGKAEAVADELSNQIQFFTLRLSRLPAEKRKLFLAAKVLSPYHNFLRQIFAEAPYLLSETEEKILNLTSQTSYSKWVELTEDLLSREERLVTKKAGQKPVLAPLPVLFELIENPVPKIRHAAGAAINDILKKWLPVAEAELNAVLAYKQKIDELRGHTKPESARLLSDQMDEQVVETMLRSVEALYPLVHRYYYLKARLLGQKSIEYYERSTTIGQKKIHHSFDQSLGFVRRAFQKLDPTGDFSRIFERLVTSGRYDVFPRKGRADGAFCSSSLHSLPTYMLLNHTGSVQDTLTLGHETGHAFHDELSRVNHALDFGASTATAETASTFVEAYVLKEVMEGLEVEDKFALLCKSLESTIATIFRQVAAYRFEQELHRVFREQGYLSAKEIGALFKKHMTAVNGPAVKMSPGMENWWVYWSHFRRFFYVYTYASGLLISRVLQAKVRAKPEDIELVKGFLRAGDSAPPRELFARLGLDIADPKFWQIGLDTVVTDLAELEKMVKKMSGKKKPVKK